MTEQTAPPSPCWCCGSSYPDDELVHLGQHPEVAVCLGCTRWLRRRATRRLDDRNPSVRGRFRAGVAWVRSGVMKRGWHERGLLGALLRRIDRHLP